MSRLSKITFILALLFFWVQPVFGLTCAEIEDLAVCRVHDEDCQQICLLNPDPYACGFTTDRGCFPAANNEGEVAPCSTFEEGECRENVQCYWAPDAPAQSNCVQRSARFNCSQLSPAYCNGSPASTQEGGDPNNTSLACVWSESANACITATENYVASQYQDENREGLAGALPDCTFDGTCRDINVLLDVAVSATRWLFGIIGTVAFVMFIYGGGTMMLSMGSSDKVKKGRDILVGAIVGMVIAFSAYLIVDFLLDALQVAEDFRGI